MDRREFLTNTAALAAAPLVNWVAPEPNHVTLDFNSGLPMKAPSWCMNVHLDSPVKRTRVKYLDLILPERGLPIDPPYSILTYRPASTAETALFRGDGPGDTFERAKRYCMAKYEHRMRPDKVRLTAVQTGLDHQTQIRSLQIRVSRHTPQWAFIHVVLLGIVPVVSPEDVPPEIAKYGQESQIIKFNSIFKLM